MKRSLRISALFALIISSSVNANSLAANIPAPQPSVPKNIIIMIGDGMGPAYISAYRYFKDNPDTQEIEQTVFNRLLVGMASTYPARESGYITDSAAAATALATGNKTYNGAVSVDSQHHALPTIMELAKQQNMSTGVAVTSQINHATPAAFLSHNKSRKNYIELANSYLNTDADVMLGGGQKYFDADLQQQFVKKGYQVITDFDELENITQPKVMGLFAHVQMPWVLDDQQGHRLSKMTSKALTLLSQNEKGFVLLIEGSLIDWAGHDNDIAVAMAEVDEFANTMEIVEQYIRQHPDTLMVATADHNTGGLSIGLEKTKDWVPSALKNLTASTESLAKQAMADEQWQNSLAANLGLTLDTDALNRLATARAQDEKALTKAIRHEIDLQSHTGWTTGKHTATDVPVFAVGLGSELFIGHQDNTDIANKLISLLPKKTNETTTQ